MTTAAQDHPLPDSVRLGDHASAMQLAISLARQSPPRPTNFAVGCVLVDEANGRVQSSGFTLELPGNTHAEECCLRKLQLGIAEQQQQPASSSALYVTMEPCSRRLSGNQACVDRLLACRPWLRTVYYGFREPADFVADNDGLAKLAAAGIRTVHVPGFEDEIKAVAKAGHGVHPNPA